MPRMNGPDLVSRLAKARPGIKALFMSGYTDNPILHNEVLDGGAAIIEKPFTPEQLSAKVRAVLGPPLPATHVPGIQRKLR